MLESFKKKEKNDIKDESGAKQSYLVEYMIDDVGYGCYEEAQSYEEAVEQVKERMKDYNCLVISK